MTESIDNPEAINKWRTREAKTLLLQHFKQDLESGIFAAYIKQLDNSEIDPSHPGQIIRSSLARSETPLAVKVDRRWYVEYPEYSGYLLEKVNPITREALIGVSGSEEDGWEETSICWVAAMDDKGNIRELSEFFTEEQARLVYKQAKELEEAGLL